MLTHLMSIFNAFWAIPGHVNIISGEKTGGPGKPPPPPDINPLLIFRAASKQIHWRHVLVLYMLQGGHYTTGDTNV